LCRKEIGSNMKKQLAFLCMILCLGSFAFAQTYGESSLSSSNIKVAYNASILYPGIRTGIESPYKQIEVTRFRRDGSVRHYIQKRYLSTELGFYHHPTFHDNIYLLAGWQTRRYRPQGFFTELSPSLGFSRTFLAGETYVVDESGNIRLEKLSGYNYLMVAMGAGCGHTFKNGRSAYARLSLLTMFPSNNYVYFRPSIDLGMIWQPKRFLRSKLRSVSVIKGRKL